MIPLPATVTGNGEDLEGFAGAGLFESVCAEEAGKLWLVRLIVYCNSWHFTPCENCATPKGSMLWQDKEGFQRLHRFLAAISL